jgi:hypothetical protein
MLTRTEYVSADGTPTVRIDRDGVPAAVPKRRSPQHSCPRLTEVSQGTIDITDAAGKAIRPRSYRLIVTLLNDPAGQRVEGRRETRSKQAAKQVHGFLRSLVTADVSFSAGAVTDNGTPFVTQWVVDCVEGDADAILDRLEFSNVRIEFAMNGGVPRSASGQSSGEKADIQAMLSARSRAMQKERRVAVGITDAPQGIERQVMLIAKRMAS